MQIEQLVDTFYAKVRKDVLLGPIFENSIQDRWQVHLEKMYRFWQTILLHEYTYKGSPFLPHAQLPIQEEHFERWIELFNETIDENFYGSKAEEAKLRATKMAEMFQSKREFIRNNPHTKWM